MSISQNKIGTPDLFDLKGHLTNTAYSLLFAEELDQMQSLEVSEHLSFCDKCISCYTDFLCGDSDISCKFQSKLISPPEPLAPIVLQKLHRKTNVIYFNKITSMIIAASFALIFWAGGIFTPNLGSHPQQILDTMRSTSQQLSENGGKIAESFIKQFDGLSEMLSFWDKK